MSNSKSQKLQLFKQIHDNSNKETLNLVFEKRILLLLTEKYLGQQYGFNTIKPIQSKS